MHARTGCGCAPFGLCAALAHPASRSDTPLPHLIHGHADPALVASAPAPQSEAAIRIVGLAHSMADAKDVGDWLGTTQHATFNFTPGARLRTLGMCAGGPVGAAASLGAACAACVARV